MAKNMVRPCSVFSSADQKILSEDTNKCLSLSKLLTLHKLYTQLLLFWFQLFRSADKIDEDDALVHLKGAWQGKCLCKLRTAEDILNIMNF
jgi:hypothetical protein